MEHRLFHTLVIASALALGACSGATPRGRTQAEAPAGATRASQPSSYGSASSSGSGAALTAETEAAARSSGSSSSGGGYGSSGAATGSGAYGSSGSGSSSSGVYGSSAAEASAAMEPTWVLAADVDASSLLALRACEVGWPTTKGARPPVRECGAAELPDGSSLEICCPSASSTPGAECCLPAEAQ